MLIPKKKSWQMILCSALICIVLTSCTSETKEASLSPRFNHVYLKVADMDRSTQFYATAFDLEVTKQIKKIKRTPINGETGEYDIFLSLLKFPGQNFVLEIGENPNYASDNTSASFTHLGIDVEDIDAASDKVLAAGGVLLQPLSLVETEDIKAKNIFFAGPDGETIELMQMISGEF